MNNKFNSGLAVILPNKKINLFDFSPYKDKKINTIKEIKSNLLPIAIGINEEIEIERE